MRCSRKPKQVEERESLPADLKPSLPTIEELESEVAGTGDEG